MCDKIPKDIKNTYKGWVHSKIVNCWFVPDGILGNLLMTLIDLVNQNEWGKSKNIKNTYNGWL